MDKIIYSKNDVNTIIRTRINSKNAEIEELKLEIALLKDELSECWDAKNYDEGV